MFKLYLYHRKATRRKSQSAPQKFSGQIIETTKRERRKEIKIDEISNLSMVYRSPSFRRSRLIKGFRLKESLSTFRVTH